MFQLFEMDSVKQCDALEVLSAMVACAERSAEEKVEALIKLVDFSGNAQMQFDDLNILVQSLCRGVEKLFLLSQTSESELEELCRRIYDSHNAVYTGAISREQFNRWVRDDVEAQSFVQIISKASIWRAA